MSVAIRVRFVRPDGAPIPGLVVRLVAGEGRAARAPDAGTWLTTDADGRIAHTASMRVRRRRVSLGVFFLRHRSQLFALGLELPLLGRPALYRLELDLVRYGTLGGMAVYLQGRRGRFDRPLVFHPETASWSLPGVPDSPRLSSRGAELRFHEVSGSAATGWAVDLVIEQHEFTMD